MKKMKRLLTLALTLTMAFSFSITASAQIKITPTNLFLFKGKSALLKLMDVDKKTSKETPVKPSEVKWKSSKSSVATVNKDGKVTAKKSGTATITATIDGEDYTCEVTVETKSEHEHSYEMEVVEHPTCAHEGLERGVCACGDECISIIPNHGMGHRYLPSVTFEATCVSEGCTYERCAECGDERLMAGSETPKTGHDYEKDYLWSAPSCTGGAYYTLVCSECGHRGEEGYDEALEHSYKSEIVNPGACNSLGSKKLTCKNCGAQKTETFDPKIPHTWTTGLSAPYWSDEKMGFVQDEITYCSVCNTRKEE